GATVRIYLLALHDALPISPARVAMPRSRMPAATPRQPPCSSATACTSGAVTKIGTQSATDTASSTPARAVACPSALSAMQMPGEIGRHTSELQHLVISYAV